MRFLSQKMEGSRRKMHDNGNGSERKAHDFHRKINGWIRQLNLARLLSRAFTLDVTLVDPFNPVTLFLTNCTVHVHAK